MKGFAAGNFCLLCSDPQRAGEALELPLPSPCRYGDAVTQPVPPSPLPRP